MPFKIYTYADPYRICETDFWLEIKDYPHLCASRTLVRGLMSVLPDEEIQTLFCPLDSIVQDRIFADWTNNISRRIQQYSELGRQYKLLHDKKEKDWNIGELRYEAINHNKNSMLDSLRLFIELGISADALDTNRLNLEHRLFAYLLKLAEGNGLKTIAFPLISAGVYGYPQREAIKVAVETMKLHREEFDEITLVLFGEREYGYAKEAYGELVE